MERSSETLFIDCLLYLRLSVRLFVCLSVCIFTLNHCDIQFDSHVINFLILSSKTTIPSNPPNTTTQLSEFFKSFPLMSESFPAGDYWISLISSLPWREFNAVFYRVCSIIFIELSAIFTSVIIMLLFQSFIFICPDNLFLDSLLSALQGALRQR